MSESKLNLWMAWIVGIILFLGSTLLSQSVAGSFGFPLHIIFPETVLVETRYYDYESDGYATPLGIFLMTLSFFVGARGGMAVYRKSLNGGVSEKGNLQMFTILICLASYAFIDTFLWENFARAMKKIPFLTNMADLGLIAGIGYLGYLYYSKKIDKIHSRNKKE